MNGDAVPGPIPVPFSGVDVRWCRPETATAGHVDETWLGLPDRQRAAAFRRPADRARFVTGRRLLAEYLRDELGFGVDDYDIHRPTSEPGQWRPVLRPRRPGLPDPPGFSISHSADRVLLAVARDPAVGDLVGVDVEQLPHEDTAESVVDDIVGHVLTSAEGARLPTDRAEARIAALQAFVRKEAVLKAVGFGLAIDPLAVEIDRQSGRLVVARFDSAHAAPLRLADLDVGEGYVAALAVGR